MRYNQPAGSMLAVLALAVFGAATPTSASAQIKALEGGELSGSATFTTDYRFRGISQTFRDPALQASAEYALPNKFYFGGFISTVDKVQFTNSRGFELDLYGGYRTPIFGEFMLDVGAIQYLYPTSSAFSTFEAYAGVSWQWISFRINNSLSNRFFGVGNARDSRYYDLTAIYPLRNDLKLIGHVGVQTIANNDGGVTDFRVGIEKTWQGFVWGASFHGTDVDGEVANAAGRVVQTAETGAVFTVSKSF